MEILRIRTGSFLRIQLMCGKKHFFVGLRSGGFDIFGGLPNSPRGLFWVFQMGLIHTFPSSPLYKNKLTSPKI